MQLIPYINKKNEIKQKEYELRSVEKDISDKQREQESLQNTIGWNEPHHEVDSSEAMKSHVSEQIRSSKKNKMLIFYN